MRDEFELLRCYAIDHSQSAFTELVERYIGIVHAAARRQVNDADLARDVTQAVFIILARKAGSVPTNRPLSAWLVRTTQYCAANARRTRDHRQYHERRVAEMAATAYETSRSDLDTASHAELAPLLDDGLAKLRSKDRDILLLKYMEQKTLAEIGFALGVSPEAAAKRVDRATERLRDFFRRRGIALSVTAVGALLASESAIPAPIGLAAVVGGGVSNGSTTATLIAKGALILMTTAKIKTSAIGFVLALLFLGAGAITVNLFMKDQSPAASASAKGYTPYASHSQWPMKFSDGTVVDLNGIGNQDSSAAWWGADGLPCPEPPFDDDSQNAANVSGLRNLRLRFQMTGPDIFRNTLRAAVVGTVLEASASNFTETSNALLRQTLVSLPPKLATTTIRVAVAHGPWADEITYDAKTGTSTNLNGSSVRIGDLTEDNNGVTSVTIYYSPFRHTEREERVVLLTKGGELKPKANSSSMMSATFRFACARRDVTAAIFRSRPFEWMEMNNVSLAPTTVPTAVQIKRPLAPTTSVSAVNGLSQDMPLRPVPSR